MAVCCGSGLCALVATLLWAARVFWTGTNQAFSARLTMQIPGSRTTLIQGDQLLAMGVGGLTMLVLAMILTALPMLIWIDLKLFRRIHAGRRKTRAKHTALTRFDGIFSKQTLWYGCATSMGSLCCFLWTAPWSRTMDGALWASV